MNGIEGWLAKPSRYHQERGNVQTVFKPQKFDAKAEMLNELAEMEVIVIPPIDEDTNVEEVMNALLDDVEVKLLDAGFVQTEIVGRPAYIRELATV